MLAASHASCRNRTASPPAERAAHGHGLGSGYAAADSRRPSAIDTHRAAHRGESRQRLCRRHGELGLRRRPCGFALHQRQAEDGERGHGHSHRLRPRQRIHACSCARSPNDSDPHFDSKVFIAPGDQAAKDRLAQLPVFVPVAELDKAKQEAAAAKAAQAAELKAEQTKAEQYPQRISRLAAL